MEIRKDFPILNKDIIYLDSCATTLKPIDVINEVKDYYENYSANAHRGDYDISKIVDEKYEDVRKKVADFINADTNNIVFTSGTTHSLNLAIKGYLKNTLSKDDIVLTTKSEHASLLLPLYDTSKEIGFKVEYMPLEDDLSLSIDSVRKSIKKNVKAIVISHITNVLGDIRPIKEIIELAHKNNIIVIIDAAQSVPHTKIDVKDLDVDFLCFSSHKMLGPTGVGVLYGKSNLLENTKPLLLGGGMNAYFDSLMNIEYKDIPHRFEAGTQNIEGVLGFGKAIDYINKIGIENINKHEIELKEYLIEKLSKLDNITIYNKNFKNGIVTFNVDKVFAQDVAIYLNKKNICIRVGNHCAKVLNEVLGVKNTCRASIYIYNTKEDIDKLVDALDNKNILFESL